jgi:Mn2+/Fe2+ NRAMP family transporter
VTSPPVTGKPPRRCRECQAPLSDEATTCWMCGGAAPAGVASAGPGTSPFKPDLNPWYLHAATWLAIVVAIAVGFGVINMSDPTLAWLYVFTVGPALVFTLAGSVVGRYTGSPWHPLKKVFVFIAAASVSALLTILIAILLLLAAIVAFLQWCFSGMPPT